MSGRVARPAFALCLGAAGVVASIEAERGSGWRPVAVLAWCLALVAFGLPWRWYRIVAVLFIVGAVAAKITGSAAASAALFAFGLGFASTAAAVMVFDASRSGTAASSATALAETGRRHLGTSTTWTRQQARTLSSVRARWWAEARDVLVAVARSAWVNRPGRLLGTFLAGSLVFTLSAFTLRPQWVFGAPAVVCLLGVAHLLRIRWEPLLGCASAALLAAGLGDGLQNSSVRDNAAVVAASLAAAACAIALLDVVGSTSWYARIVPRGWRPPTHPTGDC